MDSAVNRHELSRLRWRCRRGLLENDLLIERFFSRHGATLTGTQVRGLAALMELADNELLDLLLARTEPAPPLASDEVRQVLALMRVQRGTTAPPQTIASSPSNL
jgi:antitoxin CptB